MPRQPWIPAALGAAVGTAVVAAVMMSGRTAAAAPVPGGDLTQLQGQATVLEQELAALTQALYVEQQVQAQLQQQILNLNVTLQQLTQA